MKLTGYIVRIDQYNNVMLLPDITSRVLLIKKEILTDKSPQDEVIKIKNKKDINDCLNCNVIVKVSIKSYDIISTLSHNEGERVIGKSLYLQSIIKDESNLLLK